MDNDKNVDGPINNDPTLDDQYSSDNLTWIEKCNLDLPKEAIVSRGLAKDHVTKKEITLVGYKWQYYIKHLNELFADKWSFYIKSYNFYNNCIFVNCCLKIGNTIKEQIGTAKIGTAIEYDIKAAIDDALGRCCAFFGIGMKAYLGEEKRKKFNTKKTKRNKIKKGEIEDDTDYKKELLEYCKRKKYTARKLQMLLLQNGYDKDYSTCTDDFDEDHKLLDLENLADFEYKDIMTFIENSQAAALLATIKNVFEEYTPDKVDYTRSNQCIKNYGADILHESVKAFIKAAKAPDLIAGTKTKMWNYITAICKKKMEQTGKQNLNKKEVVQEQLESCGFTEDGNLLGTGSGSAYKEMNDIY